MDSSPSTFTQPLDLGGIAISTALPASAARHRLRGIIGTGAALPEKAVSNNCLAKILDTDDQWIRERVGIRQRHVAGPHESTLQLACEASRSALAAAGLNASQLGLIVVATVTAHQPLPSCAAQLQGELGNSNALAFDINGACSGFLFGLAAADSMLRVHGLRTALIVGSETLSRIVDWTDRSTCVLFGDGAGAVVYSLNCKRGDRMPDSPLEAVDLHTDGSQQSFICRPGGAFPPPTLPESIVGQSANDASPYVQMKGREVFKAAVASMSSSISTVLKKARCHVDDIDWFIPHQANRRIIDAVCERVRIRDRSKVIVNIERVGNTSAASIPIALDEAARQGKIRRGQRVLMSAVGAGMTWGSILLRW